MLKTVVIGLALTVLLVLGGAMLLPRSRHVERAITIEAPLANVYTLLAARHEVMEAQRFSSMTTPRERFALSPDGRGTRVVSSIDADVGAGPVGRASGPFVERRVGADLAFDLAALKALAEGLPKTDVSALVADVVQIEPVNVAYVEESSTPDPAAIATALGAGYGKVGAFMKANGLRQAGPVRAIHAQRAGGAYVFDAAIPVDRVPGSVPEGSPVKLKPTYGGRAVKAVHRGAYAALPVTYEQLDAYLSLRGLESAGASWDEFVGDPGRTQEPDLITNVYQPVK